MKFGKIVGRFYLKQDLGLEDDETLDTVTISELIKLYYTFKLLIISKNPSSSTSQLFQFIGTDVIPSIELCKRKKWNGEPDDVYFSLSDLKKPTLEEACEFVVNHIKHPDPIGCHQVWIHDEEFVRSLFK